MNVNQFLSELGQHQEVGAWHFSPASFNATLGQTIVATNLGGEVHTFTHVAEFGGGFISLLNDLAGTPVPATACLLQNLEEDDFVPPGGKYTEDVDESGTQKFQCCIHPWMRAIVEVR
jgi:plastocyanin